MMIQSDPLQYTLENCHQITGTAVVIDVRRAFTTAAWAFHQGASRILLTGTVDEALKMRSRIPGALIMGEVAGLLVPEFDLWNSPSQISQLELGGKTIIQRTSAGTQGIVRSTNARQVLGASLVVASATVRWMMRHKPEEIGFVVTGLRAGQWGEEDIACAEFMTALLKGEKPDSKAYADQVFVYPVEKEIPAGDLLDTFRQDMQLCAQVDRFDFAMVVHREGELLVMEPEIINE
jgi:2-phosphosulfolactate phosphatase